MKTIEIIIDTHPRYADVCSFAKEVYQSTLGVYPRTPPNTLIAIVDSTNIYGCVGLSNTVYSSLFLNDFRFLSLKKSFPAHTTIGEQCVFAVDGFRPAIPILIAAVSVYAQAIGINKITYATILVLQKTVEALGFSIVKLGETDPAVFTAEERKLYKQWLLVHKPVSCVLDTQNASIIFESLIERFSKKISVGPGFRPYQELAAA